MKTTVVEILQETPTTRTVRFAKPEDFTYHPGQFIMLNLPHPQPDDRGSRRSLSLSSSPTEEFLQITTREGTSSFKQTLHQLEVGTDVDLLGPMGRFLLNEDAQTPAILLAGGIGATPFRSMLTHLTHTQSTKPVTLLFSNKKPDDIVFHNHFVDISRESKYIDVINTITDTESLNDSYSGKRGRINEEMIQTVSYWKQAEYYLCGPIVMVSALQEVVKSLGISEERIKTEQFSGY